MNVTEKQKELMLHFMCEHPDFGRGRLRYKSENKRKMDELWEKLAKILNAAGFGPCKSPKEWAKTWRVWKSNTLKKAAKQKSHMLGTGGRSPLKNFQLTSIENGLLDFLTPDATGLTGIPEGGLEDVTTFSNLSSDIYQEFNQNDFEFNFPQNSFDKEIYNLSEIENNDNSLEQDNETDEYLEKQRVSTKYVQKQNIYKNREYLHSSKENSHNDDETYCAASSKCKKILPSSSAKRYQPSLSPTYSTEKNNMKEPKLMATAVNLLEKKSMSENLKQKMLELNEEKLKLKKEELAVHKGILEELQNLNNGITAIREAMLGRYLDP